MNPRTQRLCAWCGPVMIAFWAVGFALFARFVPPPAPGAGAQEIADLLRGSTNPIRFGLMLTVFGTALLGPFVGVISTHMKRIEGRHSPLAYTQLVLGACLLMEFIFPLMALQTAAFRPERSVEILQTLDDLCWIPFFGVSSTAALEAAIFGVVILQDRRDQPLFPRWSGYYTLWSAGLFTPGAILVFFKTGPFAWDGLFVFWMPVVVFSAWIVVTTVLMNRSTTRQEPPPGPDEYPTRAELDLVAGELETLRARLATTETS
jgi:hypothetical protein